MSQEALETIVQRLHDNGTAVEQIALEVGEPIAIVEELIDEQCTDLADAVVDRLDLNDLPNIEFSELNSKILAVANHLTNQTIKHIDNEFVLNRIGKASQIFKILSETAAANSDGSKSTENSFDKFFKPKA